MSIVAKLLPTHSRTCPYLYCRFLLAAAPSTRVACPLPLLYSSMISCPKKSKSDTRPDFRFTQASHVHCILGLTSPPADSLAVQTFIDHLLALLDASAVTSLTSRYRNRTPATRITFKLTAALLRPPNIL